MIYNFDGAPIVTLQTSTDHANPFSPPREQSTPGPTHFRRHWLIFVVRIMHTLGIVACAILTLIIAIETTEYYVSGHRSIRMPQSQLAFYVAGSWTLFIAMLLTFPRCLLNLWKPTAQNEKSVSIALFVQFGVQVAGVTHLVMQSNSSSGNQRLVLEREILGVLLVLAMSALFRAIVALKSYKDSAA